MTYVRENLIVLDKFGNTICGGRHTNTISARTGYFARYSVLATRWYWILMRKIIDTAFYPIDGPNHCDNAYMREEDERYYIVQSVVLLL